MSVPKRLQTPVGRAAGQRLVVLVGCPAAGKSSWARAHVAEAEAEDRPLVVDMDHVRLHPAPEMYDPELVALALFREAAEGLTLGSVVVDACNLLPRRRRAWLSLARRHGAAPVVVLFDVPWDVCAARDRVREHPVGEVGMARYRSMWARVPAEVRREPWARRLVVGPS